VKNEELKQSAFKGVLWKFAERMGVQSVTFVVSIILARLLSPNDYGIIALVTVFIVIADVFITDGFGSALIQKKDADNLDFSSVFFGGIAISIFFYVIIFLFAPLVADFYNTDLLCPVLRVIGIRIPLAAINSVQIAFVSKNMMFKKFFLASTVGAIGSSIVGILMAYQGYGVWALVGQVLFNSFVNTIVLWFTVSWRPTLKFSFKRLKGLIDFGWKILLTNLVFTLYNQLRTLIIGKLYSSHELGFYSKGINFSNLIANNINQSISAVIFPVLSTLQEDASQVKSVIRRSMKTVTYIIPPALLGLAAVSEPMVRLLLTDKWLPCVPFIWYGSIYYCFVVTHSINLEAVKGIGRSDQVLKYGFIKRGVGLVVLLGSVRFGVEAIALSLIISAICSSLINAYQNKKLFDYSYKEQFFDIFPNFLIASAMCAAVFFIGYINVSELLLLIIQIISGIIIFIGISIVCKNESLYYLINTLKSNFNINTN